jgi:hypothetical protein
MQSFGAELQSEAMHRPLGSLRFAETICAQSAIRHSSGQHRRPSKAVDEPTVMTIVNPQGFQF